MILSGPERGLQCSVNPGRSPTHNESGHEDRKEASHGGQRTIECRPTAKFPGLAKALLLNILATPLLREQVADRDKEGSEQRDRPAIQRAELRSVKEPEGEERSQEHQCTGIRNDRPGDKRSRDNKADRVASSINAIVHVTNRQRIQGTSAPPPEFTTGPNDRAIPAATGTETVTIQRAGMTARPVVRWAAIAGP